MHDNLAPAVAFGPRSAYAHTARGVHDPNSPCLFFFSRTGARILPSVSCCCRVFALCPRERPTSLNVREYGAQGEKRKGVYHITGIYLCIDNIYIFIYLYIDIFIYLICFPSVLLSSRLEKPWSQVVSPSPPPVRASALAFYRAEEGSASPHCSSIFIVFLFCFPPSAFRDSFCAIKSGTNVKSRADCLQLVPAWAVL